jgi:carboxymethylenebutenolidase
MKESPMVTNVMLGTDGAGGVLVKPPVATSGPAPAVVLLPAIAGVNDYVLRVASNLADRGYAVLAIDYFARRGRTPDLSSMEKIMAAVASVDDTQAVADVGLALDALADDPEVDVTHAGLLGFCIGGSLALLGAAALGGHLACACAWYGLLRYETLTETKPRSPLDAAAEIDVPLLGHWGDADHLVPVEDVLALRKAVRGKTAEICVYPGAGHAFHEPHRYRAVAAAEAWKRTQLYLDYYLSTSSAEAQ